MNVTVTFRHMEASDALKGYAEEKLERLKKYIDEPILAQVYLTVEKKIRHIAEISLTAKGITIKAAELTNDMYASIDAVVDKLERQVKRYKERIKTHKPSEHGGKILKKTIVEAESIEKQAEPVVIRAETVSAKPMSVDEAVMQMDLAHKDFLVFTNSTTSELNVIYRRKDGNYGLIEPAK
ncbi:MAG: ribosome-associated translation inhibitor RaiA [Desulfuromonadia bacterium]